MNWTIQRLALAAALGLTLAACGGDSGSDGGATPQPNEPEEPETPVDPEPEPEPEGVASVTVVAGVVVGRGGIVVAGMDMAVTNAGVVGCSFCTGWSGA